MARTSESMLELPSDRLCPVGQVARYLSLSRSKVYQMMDAGELPYVKLGKSRRVRWEDVLQLVARNTVARGYEEGQP